MAAVPELFRHYPTLRTKLPWTALARPTPVQALELPAQPGPLWIKRDDLTSATFGGHAAREFEFLLGEALRRGARRLLFFGATTSTQGLALASLARSFEMEVILALAGAPGGSRTHWLREQERRLGVCVHRLYRGPWEILRLLRCCASPRARRGRPRFPAVFWPRKSSLLEALGASNGVFELQRQIRCGLLPEPESLYVGSDSLPTLAGLAAGCELAGLRARLVTLRQDQVRPARQLARRVFRFLQRRVPEIPRMALRADRIALRPEPRDASTLPDGLGSLGLATPASILAMQALLADARRHAGREPFLFWLADVPPRPPLPRPSEERRRTSPAHA